MGMFELALIAVGAVFGVSIVASLFSRPTAEQGGEGGILSGYLLANGRLSSVSLISLLLSTSFGLNTMFYQGWLGYRVGVWGIVIQAFWGLSFWWLAKYAVGVRSSKSLHDFLAQKYGALA